MSGKSYLLDTNILIAFLKNDPSIIKRFEQEEIFVPIIAIGELVYGAQKSNRAKTNLKSLRGFCQDIEILDTDVETAFAFGEIQNQLRKIGKPIPVNDIWIAAIASRNNLTVVTRDKHFSNIDGLPIESW